jgi:hypothetical protein
MPLGVFAAAPTPNAATKPMKAPEVGANAAARLLFTRRQAHKIICNETNHKENQMEPPRNIIRPPKISPSRPKKSNKQP